MVKKWAVNDNVGATDLQKWENSAAIRLNVLDYGATGDGVTPDTAAFVACQNAANAYSSSGLLAGVLVTVPPGKYIVDTQIQILGRVAWEIVRGAWVQRPSTSTRTDAMFVLNGNEAELVGRGKVECLTACPNGAVVCGTATNTAGGRVAMTSGSNVVTAESAIFTASMVGWTVGINGAAAAGARLGGTITAFTDSTHVTVSTAASTTVSHVRGLFGTGGRTVSWAHCDIRIYGRNAAAGSGDIGFKFNSYPQSSGLITAQNKARVLCWGFDCSVEFGPEANLNTLEHVDSYNTGTVAVRFNEADENRVNSGTISHSTNVTLVKGIGGIYNRIRLSGEPGGASAKGCDLNADCQFNYLELSDNASGASVDLGLKNTIVSYVGGPFPNTRITTYPAASGSVVVKPNAIILDAVHDLTLVGNVTLTLPPTLQNGAAVDLRFLLRQDATGGRTVTWPTSVKWDGGTTPTFDTAANHMSIVKLSSYDQGVTWRGRLDWSGAI